MCGISCVWLFATPSTVAHEVLPSMEFPRQKYWSGLLLPSPEDLPNAWIEPASPVSLTLQADSLPLSWAINSLSSMAMLLSWILPKSYLIVSLIQNFKNGSIYFLRIQSIFWLYICSSRSSKEPKCIPFYCNVLICLHCRDFYFRFTTFSEVEGTYLALI